MKTKDRFDLHESPGANTETNHAIKTRYFLSIEHIEKWLLSWFLFSFGLC